MAVAFGSISAVAVGTSTVDKPASTSSGDLLMIFWDDDGGGTASLTGWTAITPKTQGSYKAGVLWRVADGSEGATFTVSGISGGDRQLVCIRYTGTHQTTPINGSNFTGSSGAALTNGDITTTVDGCMEVSFVMESFGTSSTSAAAGWTRRQDGNGTHNWWGAERAQASAGATGTQNFSVNSTGGDNIALHVAVAPPSAAAAATPGVDDSADCAPMIVEF